MGNAAFASGMAAHLEPSNPDVLCDVWDGAVWNEIYTDDPKMKKHFANMVLALSTDGTYCI